MSEDRGWPQRLRLFDLVDHFRYHRGEGHTLAAVRGAMLSKATYLVSNQAVAEHVRSMSRHIYRDDPVFQTDAVRSKRGQHSSSADVRTQIFGPVPDVTHRWDLGISRPTVVDHHVLYSLALEVAAALRERKDKTERPWDDPKQLRTELKVIATEYKMLSEQYEELHRKYESLLNDTAEWRGQQMVIRAERAKLEPQPRVNGTMDPADVALKRLEGKSDADGK